MKRVSMSDPELRRSLHDPAAGAVIDGVRHAIFAVTKATGHKPAQIDMGIDFADQVLTEIEVRRVLIPALHAQRHEVLQEIFGVPITVCGPVSEASVHPIK